jgi:hypothetical protein
MGVTEAIHADARRAAAEPEYQACLRCWDAGAFVPAAPGTRDRWGDPACGLHADGAEVAA